MHTTKDDVYAKQQAQQQAYGNQGYTQQNYVQGAQAGLAGADVRDAYGLDSSMAVLGKGIAEAFTLVDGISGYLGLHDQSVGQGQQIEAPHTPIQRVQLMNRGTQDIVSRLTVILDHLRS